MTQILKPTDEQITESVALAIAKEIGWGTFSHFDPEDLRRISRAAIAAMPASDELREALRKLSFAAQTSGGTAGRDEALVAAINEAERVLRNVGDVG